jgi:hypothetical protein
MKFKVINGEPLQFHNQNGDLTGTIQISSSGDMIIRPESGSNNIIIGDATTTSTVEFGTTAAPVTLDLLGGGTITSNGNTLNIGSAGDTVRINNAIFTQSLQITGSLRVSGSAYATYFVGDGSGLTNVTALSASYATTASYVSYVTPRVQSVTSAATVTATSTNDLVKITAQAAALALANPTGTFAEGQALIFRIKDNGTARAITFGANFRAVGVTLPTTTTISKTTYVGCIYNSTDDKFDVIASLTEA